MAVRSVYVQNKIVETYCLFIINFLKRVKIIMHQAELQAPSGTASPVTITILSFSIFSVMEREYFQRSTNHAARITQL